MNHEITWEAWRRFLRAAGLRYSGRCLADGSLELVPIH